MKGLNNKRIAVAADRNAEAISTLIDKKGGTAVHYPVQGEMVLNEAISTQNVLDLLEQKYDWVILTTGIGAKTLGQSAANNGIYEEYIKLLQQNRLAIRGSKTLNWLKENDLTHTILAEDGTMENLLNALKGRNQADNRNGVFLQAYNQYDAEWKNALEELGYSVYLSQPYAFKRPTEQTVGQLRKEIIQQSVDAVLFTSKTQVQNLFANQSDKAELVRSFNELVLPVAVGKVTAGELEHQGIYKVVQPKQPKMGAMVVAVEHYYQQVT